VVRRSQDLKLAAARYVLGAVTSEELARIADTLLTEGVYSPAIGELGTTRGLVMAEAGSRFEQALRQGLDEAVEFAAPHK
jgi:hypothetical protein